MSARVRRVASAVTSFALKAACGLLAAFAVFTVALALLDAEPALCGSTLTQLGACSIASTTASIARALCDEALRVATTLLFWLIRRWLLWLALVCRRLLLAVFLVLVHRRMLAVAGAIDATWCDIAFIDSRNATWAPLCSSIATVPVRLLAFNTLLCSVLFAV